MKKFFSLLFCLLLFSGCSQPAAEESSSPTANTTPTSTIEATSVPTATPSPTPYSGSKIEYFENIINYNFYATSNAVQKRPEDFTTEEEFYEFIYQDCERRHQELVSFIKSNQLTELFLRVNFLGQDLLPELVDLQYITVPCVLTDKELLNEWKDFVLNTSLKKNPSFIYDPEIPPTGMGRSILYCANMGNKHEPTINSLFKDNLCYYYPNHATSQPCFFPVTYADWDEETQKRYENFENKIYQLAADKFKAAYEQAANYPFLN